MGDEEVAPEIVGFLLAGVATSWVFEHDVAEFVGTRKPCTIVIGTPVIEDDLCACVVVAAEGEGILGYRDGKPANMRR